MKGVLSSIEQEKMKNAGLRYKKTRQKKFDREKEIFQRYAVKYGMEEKPYFEDKKQIDREWYVYRKIKEKGLENTNVEKLLDVILDDIGHQYEVKRDIENKAGFLLALWGVFSLKIWDKGIVAGLFTMTMHSISSLYLMSFSVICFGELISSMFAAFAAMTATLIKGTSNPLYGYEKDTYFRCAVDDKEMSVVYMLDVNANIWRHNEDLNRQKFEAFIIALASMFSMVVFVFIQYVL